MVAQQKPKVVRQHIYRRGSRRTEADLQNKVLGRVAGELAVIVAGVLVALWIEGWRQARTDAVLEQEYLQRIEADLLADSSRFAERMAAEGRAATSAEAAMRFAQEGWGTGPDTIAVLKSYNFAGFINFLRLQSTTWDDLVSTGNLRILRDAGVRQALGAYHKSATVQFLAELDDSRKEQVWYRYRPALGRYFPIDFENQLRLGDDEIARPLPAIDFASLRRDPEVIAGLKAASGLSFIYGRSIGTLADENEQVLSLVRRARRSR